MNLRLQYVENLDICMKINQKPCVKRKLIRNKKWLQYEFWEKGGAAHIHTNLVEIVKSLMETKQLLEKTQSGNSVSRALVYRWHRRFIEDSSAPLC